MSWFDSIKAFNKDAPKVEKSRPEPAGLIEAIIAELEVKREHRDKTELHASDLTKEDFCPREVALAVVTGTKTRPSTIDTALAVTFDLGNAVSDLVREKWLGQRAWGDWECQKCSLKVKFQPKPEPYTLGCYHRWRYVEVMFTHPQGWTGSIDVFAKLGDALYVVEVKTITPVDFKDLAGPMAEHRLRTALYLKLIHDSGQHPDKNICLDRAFVLYVSRAFGLKNDDHGGRILPFRSYEVARNDADVKPYLDYAERVKLFREKAVIPPRLAACEYTFSPRAKGCSCLQPCFSGKFFT